MIAEAAAPDTASDVAWSPDGKRIAYRIGDTLYSRASDGGGSVTRIAGAFELHSPAWSPDGRWIAFVSGNRWFVTEHHGKLRQHRAQPAHDRACRGRHAGAVDGRLLA